MSKYQVVWQEAAYLNLLNIREEIEKASQSIEIANKILSVIYNRTEDLANFPNRYPSYLDRPQLRRMVISSDYCVFYRVVEETKTVRIFNVLRSSTDTLKYLDSFTT